VAAWATKRYRPMSSAPPSGLMSDRDDAMEAVTDMEAGPETSRITHLFAGVPVSDLNASVDRYTRLFGRPPGHRVGHEMLWGMDEHAWLLIELNAPQAGAGRVTLAVGGLDALLERVAVEGIEMNQSRPTRMACATSRFPIRTGTRSRLPSRPTQRDRALDRAVRERRPGRPSDGVIQAHVSMLLVEPNWRGRQLGFRLLREGTRACRRPAAQYPHSDRGLLRAVWREPLARLSPHARAPRARSHRISCGEVKRARGERSWIS
jgi:GNAT superfamily N-acetyltransferase